MKIYVVVASEGEYSDRTERLVRWFRDASAAATFEFECEKQVKAYRDACERDPANKTFKKSYSNEDAQKSYRRFAELKPQFCTLDPEGDCASYYTSEVDEG